MRIDNKPFDRNAGLSAAEAASSQSQSTAGSGRTGRHFAGEDSVSLSGMADLIALASRVSDTARNEHVSRIAAQYRDGSYVINNEALADALLSRAM
jgi:anti-sigma28 factor (negative regulator of flagellin synthesis)